jgi:hypothetical protein
MKTHKEDLFVAYSIALLLNEKGFYEHCLGYIKEDGIVRFFDMFMLDKELMEANGKYNGVLVPTIDQAVDWLNKKYAINVYCLLQYNNWYWFMDDAFGHVDQGLADSRKDGLLKGITETLNTVTLNMLIK